jgi:hypothetical protein
MRRWTEHDDDDDDGVRGDSESDPVISSDHDVLREIFGPTIASSSSASSVAGGPSSSSNANANATDDGACGDSDAGGGRFASPLGRRIWRRHIRCIASSSSTSSSSFIPSPLPSDMLRLPSSIVRIRRSHGRVGGDDMHHRRDSPFHTHPFHPRHSHPEDDGIEWTTVRELESRMANATRRRRRRRRRRRQHPPNDAASEASRDDGCHHHRAVLVHRDSNVGLGMTLRVHGGRAYVHELLRLDGSTMDAPSNDGDGGGGGGGRGGVDNGRWDGYGRRIGVQRGDGGNDMEEEEEDRYLIVDDGPGPAWTVGLRRGDALLGINGMPFLYGGSIDDICNDDDDDDDDCDDEDDNNCKDDDVASTGSERDDVDARLAPRECSWMFSSSSSSSSDELLRTIGDVVRDSLSPMVLHIRRPSRANKERIVSLLTQESRLEKDIDVVGSGGGVGGGVYDRDPPDSSGKTMRVPLGARIHPASAKSMPIIPPIRRVIVHPFARALSERNIIQRGREEVDVTRQLRILTDRTRQWESKLSFRLRSTDFMLRPVLDARDVEHSYYASFLADDCECPQFFDYKHSKSIRSYAPSTPLIRDWRLSHPDGHMLMSATRTNRRLPREAAIIADLYAGLDDDDADMQDILLGGMRTAAVNDDDGVNGCRDYASRTMYDKTDVFVPLAGVRKALCVRLLNSFLDNRNRTAFTIWCYDVESGKEWWAPVRYYNDFKDLRLALIRIDKTVADIPFPALGWNLSFSSEAKESAKTKDARRNQLEIFLRRVFACVYRGRLHPYLAEIAIHLQTFVGCDTVLGEGGDINLSKQVAISESSYGKRTPDPKSEPVNNARMHLKRSIMRYVYRLFLLPSVEELISRFVDAAREKVTSEVPTSRHPHQFSVDKQLASKDVGKIRDFIDQMQDLILDGCRDDFISMSERREFLALDDDDDNSIRDDLLREAVREQTELEIYVPLRSTISKYLVYAWFNEDMEIKHKMRVSARQLTWWELHRLEFEKPLISFASSERLWQTNPRPFSEFQKSIGAVQIGNQYQEYWRKELVEALFLALNFVLSSMQRKKSVS